MTDARIPPGGGTAKPPPYGDVMAPVGKAVRAGNDWYQDSPQATEALLRAERFSGVCWDPACGVGTIPKVLLRAGLDAMGSDIVDRGYRDDRDAYGSMGLVADFLKTPARLVDNIISNPPFNLAREFAECALVMASHKVAFLLPLTFLEGAARTRWLETTPLARVHVFSWRISMPPGELMAAGAVKPEGGKKAFAWFVWEIGWRGPAQVLFLHKPASICKEQEAA